MRTGILTLFLGFVLLMPAARAGEDAVTGNWKVTILEKANPVEMKQMTFWLLRVENKDGKLAGSIDVAGGVPPTTLEGLAVTGDALTFSLKLKGGPTFQFDGKLPRAGAKKIYGTLGR